MIGRAVTTVLAIAVTASGCDWASGYFLSSDASSLLKRYDIALDRPQCSQLPSNREGYCEFKVDPVAVSAIIASLERDLDSRRNTKAGGSTAGMFSKDPCKSRLDPATVTEMRPRSQLGGYDLPYLGPVRFEKGTGKFCIALQYGFG